MTRRFPTLTLICLTVLAALLLTACSLGSSSKATPVGTAAPSIAPTSAANVTATMASGAPTTAATPTTPVASPTALATRSAASTTAGTASPTTTLTSAPTATGQAMSAADINDRTRPAIVQITNNQQ